METMSLKSHMLSPTVFSFQKVTTHITLAIFNGTSLTDIVG